MKHDASPVKSARTLVEERGRTTDWISLPGRVNEGRERSERPPILYILELSYIYQYSHENVVRIAAFFTQSRLLDTPLVGNQGGRVWLSASAVPTSYP
jgi:hypothetical protein